MNTHKNSYNIHGGEEENITAIEDLMREHGVLNRLLLIYEACVNKLENNEKFDTNLIYKTAHLIQSFVEYYHEKTEELYIFPILLKHNDHADLVNELLTQHKLGRYITKIILLISKNPIKENLKHKLIDNMKQFVYMYRFHESHEDTEVFQLIKKYMSKKEYEEMGEMFEKEEEQKLGVNGFDKVMNKIMHVEKKLNIYDMKALTDRIRNNINKYA